MAIDFKSMDKKKLGVMIAAVVAGFIAVILTNNYINQTVDERAGALSGLFKKKEVQQLYQRLDYLEKQNDSMKANIAAIKKQAKSSPKKETRAPEKEPPRSVTTKTPVGSRAVTVKIDRLTAAGGMVMPGDTVDIVAHLAVPTDPLNPQKGELISITLFQNILVLAVDAKISRTQMGEAKTSGGAMTITFALNPHEAGLLTFARQHGKLELVMRSPLDTQAYILPAATWKTLSEYILSTQGMDLGISGKKPLPKPMVEPKPEEREANIEVYEGGRFKGLQ